MAEDGEDLKGFEMTILKSLASFFFFFFKIHEGRRSSFKCNILLISRAEQFIH